MENGKTPAWLEQENAEYIDVKRKLSDKIDLQELFSHCHSELTDQQKKRDQLIAFYLTVSGLVVSLAFAENTDSVFRMWMFLFLGIIGFIWNIVILRYRVYKEVYWISCRVISSLYTLERSEITKERLQSVFYRVMVKKCRGELKTGKDGLYVTDKKGRLKWKASKVYAKNWKSAEKLMYSTLVLISSACFGIFLGMASYAYCDAGYALAIVLGIAAGLIACLAFGISYYVRICDVYSVVVDPTDANFNKVYEKAWFLHIFVSSDDSFEERRRKSVEKNK